MNRENEPGGARAWVAAALGVAVSALAAGDAFAGLSGGDPWPRWLGAIAGTIDGRGAVLLFVAAGVVAARTPMRRILRAGLALVAVGSLVRPYWDREVAQGVGLALVAVAAVRPLPRVWIGVLGVALVGLGSVLLLHADYGSGWGIVGRTYEDAGTIGGELRRAAWNGLCPVLPWVAFTLLGFLLEPALRRPRTALITLGLAALLAVCAEGASVVSARSGSHDEWWEWWRRPAELFGLDPIPPGPLFVVHGAAVATVVLAACRLVASTGRPGHAALVPLVVIGRAPWTASLVGGPAAVAAGDALGAGSLEVAAVAGGIGCATALVVGIVLRLVGWRGPVEALAGWPLPGSRVQDVPDTD